MTSRTDAARRPDRAVAESDEAELDRARDALTWWRSLHARRLSTVAANRRYQVDQAEGRILGRIEVTQRLKRLNTIIDKLAREQGWVTQMHDIGGVRALLPSLAHTVEDEGRQLGVGLKFGAGGAGVHAFFAEIADTLARFDRGELSEEELRVALKPATAPTKTRRMAGPLPPP